MKNLTKDSFKKYFKITYSTEFVSSFPISGNSPPVFDQVTLWLPAGSCSTWHSSFNDSPVKNLGIICA